MAQSMNTESRNAEVCLQHILSLIVGYAFLGLFRFLGNDLSVEMELGMYAVVSTTIVNTFLSIVTNLLVAIGIVFALVLYKLPEKNRATANTVGRILFLVLQALLILSCLAFGDQIGSLYGGYGIPQEVIVTVMMRLRSAAIPMALLSAALAAVGIEVKKESLLLIFLIDLAAFVLSLIVMRERGISGAVLGLGIMQPVAVLLPNVGVWNYSRNVQETVPTYYMGMQAGESGNHPAAAQIFCPTCGARLSAEAKYCSRCGTERNILL